MNCTFGTVWDILLHVTRDKFFITHNIPSNPTNFLLTIYTIPNAVHLVSDEFVIQKQQEQSRMFDLRIKAILAFITGLGFFISAIKERKT